MATQFDPQSQLIRATEEYSETRKAIRYEYDRPALNTSAVRILYAHKHSLASRIADLAVQIHLANSASVHQPRSKSARA